jgi:hypothetical protein
MKRREEYSAPPEQVDFLEQLNDVVARGEDNLDFRPEHPHHPVILIVGAPRSGTTVLMQWLQHVGFAVPSNIAARFPRNPFFAGMLQRLLSDPTLNFHDELTIPGTQHAFHSDYGKTQSPLAPHEFSFFFRRFFPVTVGEKLDERALRNCDVDGFLRGVSMFGAALDKPVVLKGLIIQYNLHIFRNSPNVIKPTTSAPCSDSARSWRATSMSGSACARRSTPGSKTCRPSSRSPGRCISRMSNFRSS